MGEHQSLEQALEGYFDQDFEALPDALRVRLQQEAPNLVHVWNTYSPEQRRYQARWRDREHDSRHNPATKHYWNRIWKNANEIIEWESLPATTSEGKAAKRDALAKLANEQAELSHDIERVLAKAARKQRARRIGAWANYQRNKRRGWFNVADIVEAWSRQSAGPPSDATRADGYAAFARDLRDGDFEKDGKARVLLLAPELEKHRAPITSEFLREMASWRPQDEIAILLSECWIPRSIFVVWTKRYGCDRLRAALLPGSGDGGQDSAKPSGPKSQKEKMRDTLTKLRADGLAFNTKTDAYHEVIHAAGVRMTDRGWNYDTFCRHCSDLLKSANPQN